MSKVMEWACKTKEEKDRILMQMTIKEALRKHTDLVLSAIDDVAEADISEMDPEEAGRRLWMISMALSNEGYDANVIANIMTKALSR